MVDRPEMRASDADRDRIAAVLRDAHADGRLAQDELLERLGSTYEARTYGELDQLIAPVPPARSQTGRTGLTAAWWVWGTAVSVNVVIWLLVSILGGEDVYFWPAWVAGPWGVVLLLMTLASRRFDRGR